MDRAQRQVRLEGNHSVGPHPSPAALPGVTANIVLAGPPGAGKTTVGRQVATDFNRPFVDLDDEIEARTGRPPAEILRAEGESRFRSLELEALRDLHHSRSVVALGGGVLTTAEGRAAARRLGPVIRLDADRTVLAERLRAAADRPLLAKGLDALLDERALSYQAVDRVVRAVGDARNVAARVVEAAKDLSVVRAPGLEAESRILVGRDLLGAVRGAVARLSPSRPLLLVADGGVPAPVREALTSLLRESWTVHRHDLEGGEVSKTWGVLGSILEGALSAGCGRQSVVVGLGGGAVCDVANLAAHLMGRGARSVLVPTTLLAQVDASVGGKCATNLAGQRNSVGAFHTPIEVVADVDLLASQSAPDYRSGLAELVKIAVISDPHTFERLEAGETPGPDMIARAVAAKASIVAQDPLDRGLRQTLNLGHTLGHALEAASGFTLRHGEAVAIGLAATARASVRTGRAPADLAPRIEGLLQRLELPTRAAPDLIENAAHHFAADKKSGADTIEWVAIRRLGAVALERLSLDQLRRTLVELGG